MLLMAMLNAEQAPYISDDEVHKTLCKRVMPIQKSGRMSLSVQDNFAASFYLHRTLRHWG